jgi:hypothetical protein
MPMRRPHHGGEEVDPYKKLDLRGGGEYIRAHIRNMELPVWIPFAIPFDEIRYDVEAKIVDFRKSTQNYRYPVEISAWNVCN